MDSIVIALPKIEDAKKLRAVLERHGFSVAAVSSSGSGALSYLSELGNGVLICGRRLSDTGYLEIKECMPEGFEMLLLASAGFIQKCSMDSGTNMVETAQMILMLFFEE